MDQNYVALKGNDEDEDELGSVLSDRASSVRDRAKTPYHGNDKNGANNGQSSGSSFVSKEQEIIAHWRVFVIYKLLFCTILILFSLGVISAENVFRHFQESNAELICPESLLNEHKDRIQLFQTMGYITLSLSILVSMWSAFTFFRTRSIYNRRQRAQHPITTMDQEYVRRLRYVDVGSLVFVCLMLTVSLSIVGIEISMDIRNLLTLCPDNRQHPYSAQQARHITSTFTLLEVMYWVSLFIIMAFVFILQCLLQGKSKDTLIQLINVKICGCC